MEILSLEEFRASRLGPLPDIRMIFGNDDAEEPMPGYEYAGPSCISLDKDGNPYLVIYNQQWIDTLDKLEEILYEEFYLPECCGKHG